MGGDAELVERLRSGDQEALVALVRRCHPTVIRLAATYVPGCAAEEVARDTWLGMLCGLDGFDGRASLRAWLFGVLMSRARSGDDRGRHSGPVTGYAAGPGRFRADGSWVLPPVPWPGDAGERLRAPAAWPAIWAAIEELPHWPRRVVLLHDVEGLASREVSELLAISDARQRVLLHHGRSRIRPRWIPGWGALPIPQPAAARSRPSPCPGSRPQRARSPATYHTGSVHRPGAARDPAMEP